LAINYYQKGLLLFSENTEASLVVLQCTPTGGSFSGRFFMIRHDSVLVDLFLEAIQCSDDIILSLMEMIELLINFLIFV